MDETPAVTEINVVEVPKSNPESYSTLVSDIQQQEQQITSIGQQFDELVNPSSEAYLQEDEFEMRQLQEELAKLEKNYGEIDVTNLQKKSSKNKRLSPYTVDEVENRMQVQEQLRKGKDRHPLVKEHYSLPNMDRLPYWITAKEEPEENMFDEEKRLFDDEIFFDSDTQGTEARELMKEALEQREINLEDVFTRTQAITRSELALKNIGIHISPDLLKQLQGGSTENIDIEGNSLELRQSKSLWYGLLYDKNSQRYNYIGIDGNSVPIDSSPNTSLYVQHRNKSYDPDRELLGNDEYVYKLVTRITDAAVASLSSIGEKFVTIDSMQLEDFDEEKIKQLNFSEYIDFMKKLSGHFDTHIVRFGLVTGMSAENNAGQGKYFGSIQDVLRSQNLKSPYDLIGDSTTAIGKIYQEEGIKRATLTKTINLAPELVDRSYAGEDKNEPFVFFPAEVLSLHNAFSGHMDFDPREKEGHANWEISSINSEHQSSIPLDEGIVFLPSGLQVDPRTGSQYAIENGNGVVNQEMVQAMENFLNKTDQIPQDATYQNLLKQIYVHYDTIDNSSLPAKEIPPYAEELQNFLAAYGFPSAIARQKQEEIVRDIDIYKGQYEMYKEIGGETEAISAILKKLQLLYKPAETTIPSKDYWKRWFATNPNAKPVRVEFYDGDPNTALINFLLMHKIIKSSDVKSFYNHYDQRDSLELKQREEKLHIPSGITPDIANFRIHEFGNWMYRLAETELNKE